MMWPIVAVWVVLFGTVCNLFVIRWWIEDLRDWAEDLRRWEVSLRRREHRGDR